MAQQKLAHLIGATLLILGAWSTDAQPPLNGPFPPLANGWMPTGAHAESTTDGVVCTGKDSIKVTRNNQSTCVACRPGYYYKVTCEDTCEGTCTGACVAHKCGSGKVPLNGACVQNRCYEGYNIGGIKIRSTVGLVKTRSQCQDLCLRTAGCVTFAWAPEAAGQAPARYCEMRGDVFGAWIPAAGPSDPTNNPYEQFNATYPGVTTCMVAPTPRAPGGKYVCQSLAQVTSVNVTSSGNVTDTGDYSTVSSEFACDYICAANMTCNAYGWRTGTAGGVPLQSNCQRIRAYKGGHMYVRAWRGLEKAYQVQQNLTVKWDFPPTRTCFPIAA